MSLPARRKIIFDMDGVITGEERYWDAAALTVYELFFSERYLNIRPLPGLPVFKADPSIEEIAAIRRVIFCGDRVIAYFKQRALNSNWDLAFLTFSFQLISMMEVLVSRGVVTEDRPVLKKVNTDGFSIAALSLLRPLLAEDIWQPSFEDILTDWTGGAKGGELLKRLITLIPRCKQIFGESSFISFSPLWRGVQEIFQEWYFGEQAYRDLVGKNPGTPGKKGLIYREEPLMEVSRVRATLEELLRQGWELGIATGRPMNELYYPLQQMDLWKYFHPGSVITFDQVEKAGQKLKKDFPRISLGKPHPYPFLKAYWGEEKDDRELVASPPLPQQGMCWAVGDSLADLLAARGAGAGFIGVLTGHNGKENKPLFEKEGAAAVLPDMTCLPDFFAQQSF